jgi:hypothetical protein
MFCLIKALTQLTPAESLKRPAILFLLFVSSLGLRAQGGDTLFINYFSHTPFAYTEGGNVKGIESDIINEYILWLATKKKITTTFKYNEFTDFTAFYNQVKKAPKNTIGLGAVTISPDKAKEVDFSTPFIKNVAFCVTNGHAPDVKTKNADEITRALGSMNALTIENTALNKYVSEIKKTYIPDLKIAFHSDQVKILDEIAKNVLNFGYVDAIGFWFYLKSNPGKFLKMQKVLSQSKEQIGLVMPKGSPHKQMFDEFFAGPGGFKSSPTYRAILEKHLGSYMTQNVAVD